MVDSPQTPAVPEAVKAYPRGIPFSTVSRGRIAPQAANATRQGHPHTNRAYATSPEALARFVEQNSAMGVVAGGVWP